MTEPILEDWGDRVPPQSHLIALHIDYRSNAKTRFQSFFMLMTVQPSFFASS